MTLTPNFEKAVAEATNCARTDGRPCFVWQQDEFWSAYGPDWRDGTPRAEVMQVDPDGTTEWFSPRTPIPGPRSLAPDPCPLYGAKTNGPSILER
jgi:hypothetical protein